MRAYMKPRRRPSRTTWGRMPMRRDQSITQRRERAVGRPRPSRRPTARTSRPCPTLFSARPLLLGGGRRSDGQLLDDLVVAPLLGIVTHDLQHEIEGLLAIA